MAEFDTKTMYAFERFLKLQKSGELNMASPEARQRLDVTKEEHAFILENYSVLLEEYSRLHVVNDLIKWANDVVDGKISPGLGFTTQKGMAPTKDHGDSKESSVPEME